MESEALLAVLGRLRAARLRFRAVSRDPIVCGDFPASALRGGFLAGLLDVGCVVPSRDCPRCELASHCAVPRVSGEAERASPTRTPLYRTSFDIASRTIEPEEPFEFGIDLFGAATELRSLAIGAVERFAERGFGRRRARFRLLGIDDLGHPDGGTIEAELRRLTAGLDPRRIAIRLRSPLRLTDGGRAVRGFSFEAFLSSLLRRARLLLESGEGLGFEVDATALRRGAAAVRVVAASLSKQDQVRYSARQGRSMNLHGARGDVVIEGELAPFVPWLAFGVLAGVGKGATFGHGVYTCTQAEPTGARTR